MLSTRRLSRLALAATLALVGIGGFTRGSDSGYGCADRWPLCENGLLGGLLPRAEYHMIIEWTHRWAAALVGILAIATAVAAWRHHRHRLMIVLPAIAAVAAIGVQAWVGRLVVKGALDRDLVSVHLAISMTVVALLTIVLVTTSPSFGAGTADRDREWTLLLAAAAAGSLALLLLGSYVHNLYVDGWPLVRNTLFPDLSNRFVATHYAHRVVAAAGLVFLGYLIMVAVRRERPRAERSLLYAAGVAYGVNIGLGAAHVFTRVDSSALVTGHLLMASLVWVSLVAATTISARAPISSDVLEPLM
ncbi:MAG: COX15/CtaA family protein [Acidimicrobiia bacterium]